MRLGEGDSRMVVDEINCFFFPLEILVVDGINCFFFPLGIV